jgi:hypothetical protein
MNTDVDKKTMNSTKPSKITDAFITDAKIPGKRSNRAGFVQIPNLLLYCHADIGLNPQTFTALTYLISHNFGGDGLSFPSVQNSLAPDLGKDRTTVDKWMNSLQSIDVAKAMREQANRLFKLSNEPDFEVHRYTQRIDALEKAAKRIEKEKIKGLITKVLPKNKNTPKRGRANRYNFDKLIFVLSVLAEEFNKKSKL